MFEGRETGHFLKESSRKYLLLLVFTLVLNNVHAQSPFYAYHTKVNQTSTDFVGKFADLIVVLGECKQLEFTRKTQYAPLRFAYY